MMCRALWGRYHKCQWPQGHDGTHCCWPDHNADPCSEARRTSGAAAEDGSVPAAIRYMGSPDGYDFDWSDWTPGNLYGEDA